MRKISDSEARRDMISAGNQLHAARLCASNDGNISVRTAENAVWATPTNVSKGGMTEDMLVLLDLDGNILSGSRKPSSEVKMHLEIYRANPQLRSVVHAHPPAASVLAAGGVPLDLALLQETAVLLGVIPVAPYALPGSRELALGAAALCRAYNGCLLEHHGAVTWADSCQQAFMRMESLEFNADVYLRARAAGLVRPLPNAEIERLLALRPGWGVTGGGRPRGKEDYN